LKKRDDLAKYLDRCSEDELIEEVLLPLFRQLGFHRITAGGHKDKALEYGKDVWMKYVLPTQHVLYFGLQAKKDKLDASGVTGRHRSVQNECVNTAIPSDIDEPYETITVSRANPPNCVDSLEPPIVTEKPMLECLRMKSIQSVVAKLSAPRI
jgi:hypothetical protein